MLPRIEEQQRRAIRLPGPPVSLNPRSVHVQTGLPARHPPTQAPSHFQRNSGFALFRPPHGYWDSPGFAPGSLSPSGRCSSQIGTRYSTGAILSLSPAFVKVPPSPSAAGGGACDEKKDRRSDGPYAFIPMDYFRAMTALTCASICSAVRPKRCCR